MAQPQAVSVTEALIVSASVGANTRAELARRKIPQARIAARLGISQQAISERLNGKTRITVDELVAIADEIGVDADVLLRSAS